MKKTDNRQIRTRGQNKGIRKVCGCPRRSWAKCSHPWHFNYKVRGGQSYRFSVDGEAGERIASKTEAEALADSWRTAIREGTFRRRTDQASHGEHVHHVPDVVTLETFGGIYAERLGTPISQNHRACFKQFIAFTAPNTEIRYGSRALTAFTEDDLETFVGHLRSKGFAESTINKYVQMVKALFKWATKKGYLTRNPAADSDVLTRRKHAQRERRLEPDEEARLLAHAGPHLYRLIVAALESCCRKGELLWLTWRDVNLDRREMMIRAERTKTRTGRVLPLSARLVAVLTHAATDPAGHPFGPDRFVFGDAIGRRVRDVKRAWETCVLKAHGHMPTWRRNDLSPESRQAYDAIDLHFHDLRHEAGSRLLEAGWPLHTVAHMLGHANISQTSTYLNATKVGLQEAMQRLDVSRAVSTGGESGGGKPPRCNPVANDGANRPGASVQRTDTDGAQVTVN